jgi:hypothetical protein
MEKIDYKKRYKHLYNPSAKKPDIVDVPEFQFLMIDGAIEKGKEPGNSPAFNNAIEAMYATAYNLKFMSKKNETNPIDYTVPPLEGLWWVEDGKFDISIKDNWHWRLIMMQPEFITKAMYTEAIKKVKLKKHNALLDNIRFKKFHEGKCVQMMHIGPYSTEPETVKKMKEFAEQNGYKFRNEHHEIYIGDPRKAKPEKLKTILRHPVQ